jgi:polar amino acid transport system substrate-binding protein
MTALLLILTGSAIPAQSTAQKLTTETCSRPLLVAASPLGRSMIISEDGLQVSGATYDIFNKLAKDTGCSFTFLIVPRARAFVMLKAGEVDLVTDATRTPDRETDAYFVEVGKVTPALIALTRNPIGARSTTELIDGKDSLIAIHSYDYGPAYRNLLAHPKVKSRVTMALTAENAMKMLLRNRARAILASPNALVDAWMHFGNKEDLTIHAIDGMPDISYGLYISKTRMLETDTALVERAFNTLIQRGDIAKLSYPYYPSWVTRNLQPTLKRRSLETSN